MRDVRTEVREHYAARAREGGAGCGCGTQSRRSCCGPAAESASRRLGYRAEDLSAIPAEADLGLGCGNPTALAGLRAGETVVDLGSGGGIDCFLAARKVGPTGRVIGVDMTPEMIDRARQAAAKGSHANVEFRLGEIESLPVADATADTIISNCVINLSPDKPRAFREAFRILRPGGRLMVSDMVLRGPLPEVVQASIEAWAGCVAGAMLLDDYLAAIRAAGFSEVVVESEKPAGDLLSESDARAFMAAQPGIDRQELTRIAGLVVSVAVRARKPAS
jgi:arsenite methyltransferase